MPEESTNERYGCEDTSSLEPSHPLFAMVCANNVNRSAAAHEVLDAAGLRVCSYGAGRQVILAGQTGSKPRTFQFLTPYATMYDTLKAEDAAVYTDNGVLGLLERDRSIKKAPERWQSLSDQQLVAIDVVVCLDYAMFVTVLEDVQTRVRQQLQVQRLHLICLDTVDTPEEAVTGSERVLSLCRELNVPQRDLTETFVVAVVERFEKQHEQQVFYLGLHA
ncbi:unnamed protein product [Hyaloperonospora brassicae]|uniref:RNA polymerase II subunit A C-terminal domain phosphatase SSU72 n=1 Tax=Hyaloperonospora brassicae TaxID=162125 RepID=A0AAV0THL7_HYABA|nr:unnamed protein product [Hyaloperonospora brassicae]